MKTRLMTAILLTAMAAPAMAKIVPVPDATPTGKPESCVRLTDVSESRVRSDRVIDFYMRNGRVLRNTLPNSCSRLGFEQSFSYQVTNNQLCSVDIIRVIDRGMRAPGVACGLGQFQPVTVVGR